MEKINKNNKILNDIKLIFYNYKDEILKIDVKSSYKSNDKETKKKTRIEIL